MMTEPTQQDAAAAMPPVDLRSRILAADDIETELVEVPEWGVTVEVRSLTAQKRAKLLNEAANNGKVDLQKIYPDMVIASTFDPQTSKPIFGDLDREALGGKSGKAVERIATVAGRLSGMNGDTAGESDAGSETAATG